MFVCVWGREAATTRAFNPENPNPSPHRHRETLPLQFSVPAIVSSHRDAIRINCDLQRAFEHLEPWVMITEDNQPNLKAAAGQHPSLVHWDRTSLGGGKLVVFTQTELRGEF